MARMSAPLLSPVPAAEPATTLFVRTQRIEEDVDLLGHLPADVSGAWLRHGQGVVARGTAWSVRSAGPHRFAGAGAAFRQLADRARVDDEVRVRTSGLIALGSFSYADASQRPSTLMVPRALLGVHDGEAFLTVVGVDEEPVLPASWQELFPSTPVPAECAEPLEITAGHTPDEYQALVQEAIAGIRAGRAEKVVLSERTTVRTPAPLPPAVMLARLARAYPSTWVYHLEDVVGASPEMLAQTEDGRVYSRVLAGSRPVADDGELDEVDRRAFRTDAKERSEHAFAVDSVIERLEGVAEELEVSPEPFVLRLPGLEHLASDVSARLREGTTSLDVASRLHPSAAVSGTPREDADEIIADLEPHDRGGYASPVGWMDGSGDGQWAIALRMAHVVDERTVVLQAGGGLVAASDPVSEHAEALAKCRPMLRALRGEQPS
ncbi:Menaquinone-specific isochorismate synthase [Brachybacterium faecium]|uniref:isochorismate synthase n=1 Tax=Brachybacterium faecium (strain ATCC 43885 / DSM 4810 / JCM 11609 / LMG 19847 / NBRC 14762 / NCIMB 9860 / 6-10) TaxID=446465 RepID=C7MFI8_BRAFD|nr:isochorismate synthase family protein [Brachybacterium faecium DSM 4810]SLM94776.1 Menaquinone-specific isochorismate synthase [Brachybacterium faecium]